MCWGRVSALCVLTLATLACGRGRDTPAHPPNLVLIVIDTARADHFSSHGYPHPTTPHVDALAARGLRFARAHSVAPWTLPAHMSMWSGLVPRDHGATWAAYSEPESASLAELISRAFVPRAPERMLPVRLRAAGYATWAFSPNPWISGNRGFAEGFDAFYELWRPEERTRARGRDAADAFEESPSGSAVAGAARHLARHAGGAPFFLFVNFLDPHFPYTPPDAFAEKLGGSREVLARLRQPGAAALELAMITGASPFSHRELAPLYDAELAYADHAIGALLGALETHGVLDDTLVVVTSDHGELLGEEGRFSHQLYVDEALMHVPLILKLPGDRRAGTVLDPPLASNLDVYATLLAAAGVPDPALGGGSHDLAAIPAVARRLLIGEYEPSRAYLHQLRGVNRAFDVAGHLAGRFVVWTDEHRTELAGARALGAGAAGTRAAEAEAARAAEAEAVLAAYRAARDATRTGAAGAPRSDEETRRQLEALGYLAPEEAPEAD